MEKIRKEQIGVEVFGGLQRSQILVGEDGSVLADEAKRKFPSELVVPLGADDVVVEDTGARVEAAQARKQVGVVHGELSGRTHGEINLGVARLSKERRASDRRTGRRRNQRSVVVGVGAPANLAVQSDLLEEARLKKETGE